jgi:hypothetical protein
MSGGRSIARPAVASGKNPEISRRSGPGGVCTLADMAVSSLMFPLGTPAPDFVLATPESVPVRRRTHAALVARGIAEQAQHAEQYDLWL